MEKLTLFSHVLPEEQERMRICFCMREVTYQNHEIIMEYANSMKKIGVILEGQAALYCSDADGTQYLLDELKKDSVFGEPFLLPMNPSTIMFVLKQRQRSCSLLMNT